MFLRADGQGTGEGWPHSHLCCLPPSQTPSTPGWPSSVLAAAPLPSIQASEEVPLIQHKLKDSKQFTVWRLGICTPVLKAALFTVAER